MSDLIGGIPQKTKEFKIEMPTGRLDSLDQLLEKAKNNCNPIHLADLIAAVKIASMELRDIKEYIGGLKEDVHELFEIVDR